MAERWPFHRRLVAMAAYVILTLWHKWLVLLAGRKTGAPFWRLLIHDWTKFTPSELPAYARQFFGDRGDPEGWARAWLHHQNHNQHHYTYWVTRQHAFRALRMPEPVMREMVADWMAAHYMIKGRWPTLRDWPWVEHELPELRRKMHEQTFVDTMALIFGRVLG